MEEIQLFLTDTGFPIIVTVFLLIRVERKLDDLNKTLISLIERIADKN